jgi:hypothetical protein
MAQPYFENLKARWMGYIPFPSQKVGALAAEDLKKGIPFHFVVEKFHTQCKKLTHEIMRPMKKRVFQNYLEMHESEDYPQPADDLLVKKIQEKIAVWKE